jgi:hypothetical protein
MKYLLSVLFVLALFCGVTSSAHAQNFHVGVVDPDNGCVDFSCVVYNSGMTIPGALFDSAGCSASPGVPTPPVGETAFCVDLFNATGTDVTSVSLVVPGLPGSGTCDSNSVFTADCSMAGDVDTFDFIGVLLPGHTAVIYEYGLPAEDFDTNTLSVTTTPEPDSLLLFATGAMMAGLYMAKRPLLSAFGKK